MRENLEPRTQQKIHSNYQIFSSIPNKLNEAHREGIFHLILDIWEFYIIAAYALTVRWKDHLRLSTYLMAALSFEIDFQSQKPVT